MGVNSNNSWNNNQSWLLEWKKEISEVRDTTANKTLNVLTSKENPYEWMKKVQIEVNGESKEIYIDNENLKIDSSNWKETEIDRIKFKINNEWDIVEYLEWKSKWEQLFTQDAAKREAKKLWKRLPVWSGNNPEYQYLIKDFWIQNFQKTFTGIIEKNKKIIDKDEANYFWWDCNYSDNLALVIKVYKDDSDNYPAWYPKNFLWLVRLVKDISPEEQTYIIKIRKELDEISKETIENNGEIKLDSSNWKETEINGIKVKKNLEWDFVEVLEWKLKWEQMVV